MDDSVTTVLDAYHRRIAEERARPWGDGRVRSAEERDQRLLAVGPETGQLLNLLARSLPSPTILEIGTSYGYSGIWLAEAARATGGRLITLELQDYKSAHAREKSAEAGLADHVDFQVGDALELIAALPGPFDLVLLDLWKELYVPCLEAFYPKLRPGAIIVADNMIRGGGPGTEVYAQAVRAKPGITSVLLPVGAGIEISRYQPA